MRKFSDAEMAELRAEAAREDAEQEEWEKKAAEIRANSDARIAAKAKSDDAPKQAAA